MIVKMVVPPVAEAISLDEVREHLVVEAGVDDALLLDYLRSACRVAEEMTGLAPSAARYEASFDVFPRGREILLPRPPFTALVEFVYVPAEGVDAGTEVDVPVALFYVDETAEPARLVLADGESWPTARLRSSGVRVRFDAGYVTAADMPGALRQGILMLIAHWYQTREAILVGEAGMRAQEVPFGVRELFAQVRL